MILRVAWRVVSGQGAEDTRSDDEEDDELVAIFSIWDTESDRFDISQDVQMQPVEAGPIPPSPTLKKRRWGHWVA